MPRLHDNSVLDMNYDYGRKDLKSNQVHGLADDLGVSVLKFTVA